MLEIASAFGGKRKQVDPMRFLPWREKPKDAPESIDAQIRGFFKNRNQ